MQTLNSLTVIRDEGTRDQITIKWNQTPEGEWDATRVMPAPLNSYRLYDLDAIGIEQVWTTMQQFLRRDLSPVYLAPRESSIRRRLNLPEEGCEGHVDTDDALTSGVGVGEAIYCDGSCQT